MPQLDIGTFFTQIFWLLLSFFSFYIILLKFLLPSIYKNLRLRKEVLVSILTNSQVLSEEKDYIKELYSLLVLSGLSKTKVFVDSVEKTTTFFENTCEVSFFYGQNFEISRESFDKSIFIIKLNENIANYTFGANFAK